MTPEVFASSNIDGGDVRRMFTEVYRFRCEEVEVVMTHIGGYPGHYSPAIYKRLVANPPQLFISGHSHILKVMYDKQLGCLHINPGAAGIQGFQTVRTHSGSTAYQQAMHSANLWARNSWIM